MSEHLPYSGTEVIKDYGREHVQTGDLIVYTSADSVFQIAAHESVVPPEQLYAYCRIARKLLVGKYGVGRVIARRSRANGRTRARPAATIFRLSRPQRPCSTRLSRPDRI